MEKKCKEKTAQCFFRDRILKKMCFSAVNIKLRITPCNDENPAL